MNDIIPLKIEDAEAHMDAVSSMIDNEILVTELLDGREWAATALRKGEAVVIHIAKFGDRDRAVEDERLLFTQRLDYMLLSLLDSAQEIETITLRGVVIGINGHTNYERKQPEVRLYDIELDGQPMEAWQVYSLFSCYAVLHVPVLTLPGQTLYSWLNRRALAEAAAGLSKLAPTRRHGIVLRPLNEHNHVSVGRLLLKVEVER